MAVPDWYETLLLALASCRMWRLLAEDTILDNPRSWLVGLSGWKAGQPTPVSYRAWLAEFVTCPWCLGFHIALLIYLFWLWQPHATELVSVPLTMSCIVGILGEKLSE